MPEHTERDPNQEMQDCITQSRLAREASERALAEQSDILSAVAEAIAASQETLDGTKDSSPKLEQPAAEPCCFINLLSHPVTPILAIVLFLGGIALIASGAGFELGIIMSATGVVLVGTSVATRYSFFSNEAAEPLGQVSGITPPLPGLK